MAIGAVIGQIEPAVDAPLADPEVVRPAPVAAPAEPVRAEEPTTETTPAPVTLATAHAAPPAPARVEVAAPPPPPTSITLVLPTGPPEARESRPEAGQDARVTRRPMSRLRKTLAKHLLAARHETAMLTTFNEVDMTEVLELRRRFQEGFVKTYGVKLGFMSFFVKAAVDALKAVPELNASIEGDDIVYHHHHDIGVAVSSPRGLVVPVVRDCDGRSFGDIEQELAALAVRAREGRITLDDLKGGTFTITNGGVFGSMLSTPLLNPPQVGILGMHNITERAVVVDGQVVVRPMMYLALSYDHRLIDGREAVRFLVHVKERIAAPERLLLGL